MRNLTLVRRNRFSRGTNRDRPVSKVAYDRRASTDYATFADVDALNDTRASPNVCVLSNNNFATQGNSRSDMTMGTNLTPVINAGGCVDDCVGADGRSRLYGSLGHDLNAVFDFG